MNYAALVQQLQDYLQNDETSFVDNIPTFVKLAERRIYDEAQLPVSSKNATSTLTASQPYMVTPTDFILSSELSVTSGASQTFLLNKDVSFIRECYPSSATTGLPLYYALFDHDTLLLGPTPDQNYTVELHYFAYPQSIVDAGTTWLGDRFEHALLYGSLVEGYRYMKGDADLMTVYDANFQAALELVKAYSGRKSGSDAYRIGQYNLPPKLR